MKILCLKATLTRVQNCYYKSDIIFALVRYHISYIGNIRMHLNERAISSMPISCDISTLASRMFSRIFNLSIIMAI